MKGNFSCGLERLGHPKSPRPPKRDAAVQEIVVAPVNESRGPKNDKLDAFGLAEQWRIGAIRTKVYKKRGGFGRLGYRVKAHALLVADSVRVQSRIKALLRARGVAVAGSDVYSPNGREDWLLKLPQPSLLPSQISHNCR